MIEFLAPISSRVKALYTGLTTGRMAALDNLDAAISAISPIRSIQRGTITITNGNSSNTATITSVSTSKSVVALLGSRNSSVTAFTDACVELDLTNGTTVTATRNGATGQVTARYEVCEFK